MSGPQSVVIAVGDEVLGGFILDTNSHWLAGRLREAGCPVCRIEVVGDSVEAIAAAVRRAIQDQPRLVLVCGGVGPTPDDLTLDGVAAGLDRPLVLDDAVHARIQGLLDRMHAAGWIESAEMSEANRKMAHVPAGAQVLDNRRGMAPGLVYDIGPDRMLAVLPGVPRELKTIVDEELIPRHVTGGRVRAVGELRYRHAIEAEFSLAMRALTGEFPGVSVGSYPQSETRELLIRVHADDPATLDAALRRMRELRPGAD